MRCKVCGEQVESGFVLHSGCLESLVLELRTCRNELCWRCGQYKSRHLGACDGCRWKEDKWPKK